jgi:hypothetical protein
MRWSMSAHHVKRALHCREERETDKSVDLCRVRYLVFKRHYPALIRLQRLMPFSVIDATGSIEECEAQIAHELRYQSSLDLDERTYASITTLPLARKIVQHSRKALVQRLDDYCLLHTDTYGQVRLCICIDLHRTKPLVMSLFSEGPGVAVWHGQQRS